MANTNLNVRLFPFFDSVEHPLTEAAISDSYWNSGYNKMVLEVSGEGTGVFKVEGCINTLGSDGHILDDNDCYWTELGAVATPSYSIQNAQSAITDNGIYYIDITGLSRIRIVAESVEGNGVTIVGALSKMN